MATWDFYDKDYSGQAKGHWGSDIPVGDKGFGGGHARRVIEAGYSPLSIQQWMDANRPAPHLGGNSSWQAWNIINPAVQQQRAMESLYSHFNERFEGLGEKYQAAGDYATKEQVAGNTQSIAQAMQEAQKVRQNNPYAVTGNTAMGIQQARSPQQIAGAVTQGLSGFSRTSNNKFKNKTLNV